MNIEYLPTFIKDLKALRGSPVYKSIYQLVFEDLPNADNLNEFPGVADLRYEHKNFRTIFRYLERFFHPLNQQRQFPNIKKLKCSNTAYRIRVGNYRIGLFIITNDTIQFSRVLHRREIYRHFP